MVINAANLAIIFTAFKAAFNQGKQKADPQWQRIATLIKSTGKEEKYGWLGQFPRIRKWVGDRQLKNLQAYDYAIKNEPFESTISVDRDDIDDDSYGVYANVVEDMGYAAATHPDELIFGLLSDGFTTACYDKQYFFDTDHPVNGGSVSNMQSGSGNPWFLMDTNRPLKPLIFQERKTYNFVSMTDEKNENVFMRKEYLYGVDARGNVGFGFWQTAFGSKATLNKDNFDAAMESMMGVQSDEGRPMGIKPNLLVCGVSNRAAAKATISVMQLANGASNPNYQEVEVLVVPWLP